MFYLLQFLTYALPVAAVVLFVVSLVRYIRARRANRRAPDTYNKRQMTDRLVWLIVTGVITGVMVLMILGFVMLLMMAVAFM
jgi:asparagine N-glycosylation enzyme membrane subunit Stt3